MRSSLGIVHGVVPASWVLMLVGAVVLVPATAVFADETRSQQWMIDVLDLENAWEVNKGAGVTVGIVDTGVDATHPDLEGNVLSGMATWEGGWDGLKDTQGHGTAMASVIAGHGHGDGGQDGVMGIAPAAKVLSVGADEDGDKTASGDDINKGIRWLADNGADIILLALAGGTFSMAEEQAAVQYAAVERGIPVVAGAGNVGDKEPFGINEDEPIPPNKVEFPAAYPEVIAVSGTDRDDGFAEDVSHFGPEIAVSAPGKDVALASLDHGYRSVDGTSVSSAIVAGTLALLKAEFPDETRMELFWRLTKLSTDAGETGPDDEFGYGIVNPTASLTQDPGQLPGDWVEPTPSGSYPAETSSESQNILTAGESADDGSSWWWLAGAAAVVIVALLTLLLLRARHVRSGGLQHLAGADSRHSESLTH